MARPAALGCEVSYLECGTKVIDVGLNCRGSWEAALLFTRATLGDLAHVTLGNFKLNDDYSFSSVEVYLEQPMIACMASQIAGWKLGEGEFATIGSGPARALAVAENDEYIFTTSYRDHYDKAVLCLQDIRYPTDELALFVAEQCRVKPENLYVLISSSTCIACSMQVSARMIEQTCHRMIKYGFDANQIVIGRGSAPIAPIVKDEVKTMGRINDALIYGSEAEYWVDAKDEDIEKVIKRLVAKHTSPNYGELFEEAFNRAGRDFYYVDYDIHTIGKVQIHNINSGKSFHAGEIHYGALERSFLK